MREELDAFHDGELSLELQLLVREHLETCAGVRASSTTSWQRCAAACATCPAGRRARRPRAGPAAVLEQVKVERQLSWHTWLLGVFDDMHLVWPALGATAAVLVCLLASAEVMQATNEQRPDSLAGIIGYLASPGSNVNPARIDGFTDGAAPATRATTGRWPARTPCSRCRRW